RKKATPDPSVQGRAPSQDASKPKSIGESRRVKGQPDAEVKPTDDEDLAGQCEVAPTDQKVVQESQAGKQEGTEPAKEIEEDGRAVPREPSARSSGQ
ncbi:unnamed protein product, partial [Symbiodinium pilosum]